MGHYPERKYSALSAVREEIALALPIHHNLCPTLLILKMKG
jgi:hypothetical protein